MISHSNCQELDWNQDAENEKYLCISMRGKVELTVYWLKLKHANGSDSNEIICIISTDNYTLITKIHKGNEHNYVADTMGRWIYYIICTIVYKSLLLDFMLCESKIKHFLSYTSIKCWKTEIWRNSTRNGALSSYPVLGFFYCATWEFRMRGEGNGDWYFRPLQPSSTSAMLCLSAL